MTDNLNEEDVNVHIHTITLQKKNKNSKYLNLKIWTSDFSVTGPDGQWPQILNRQTGSPWSIYTCKIQSKIPNGVQPYHKHLGLHQIPISHEKVSY